MSKKVPLVMFTTNADGVRVRDVIGEAVVNPDGTWTGKIDDKNRFADLIRGMGGDMFSIGHVSDGAAVLVPTPAIPLTRFHCTECGAAYHSDETEATVCNACALRRVGRLAHLEFKNGDVVEFRYASFNGNPNRRWEFFDEEGRSIAAYDSAYFTFVDLDHEESPDGP